MKKTIFTLLSLTHLTSALAGNAINANCSYDHLTNELTTLEIVRVGGPKTLRTHFEADDGVKLEKRCNRDGFARIILEHGQYASELANWDGSLWGFTDNFEILDGRYAHRRGLSWITEYRCVEKKLETKIVSDEELQKVICKKVNTCQKLLKAKAKRNRSNQFNEQIAKTVKDQEYYGCPAEPARRFPMLEK